MTLQERKKKPTITSTLMFSGMNKDTYTDQHYFPQNQGFEYVGTFLPFTLEDTCDEDKVRA